MHQRHLQVCLEEFQGFTPEFDSAGLGTGPRMCLIKSQMTWMLMSGDQPLESTDADLETLGPGRTYHGGQYNK